MGFWDSSIKRGVGGLDFQSLEMQGFGPHDIFPVIDSLWILVKPTDDNNGIRISVHLGLNQNRKRRTKGEFQRDAIKIIDLIREQLHIKETQRSSFYPGIAYYFLPIHEQILQRSNL